MINTIFVKEWPAEVFLGGLTYSAIFSFDRLRPQVFFHDLISLHDLWRGWAE